MTSHDSPSLDGCYIKLGRAGKHRQELRTALGPALEAIRESVVTETSYDDDASQFLVKVVYAPSIPEGISAIAGDVLHNLRSALDYAAYQAVWKSKGTPWDESQFPIATRRKWFSSRDKGTFARLDPAFVAVIKRHQFFQDMNDYRDEGLASDTQVILRLMDANRPLAVLMFLSNYDKHRLLLPRYAAVADASFPIRWTRHCAPVLSFHQLEGSVEPRAEPIAVFTANPDGMGQPEMNVDFLFRPTVGIAVHGDAEELLDVLAAKVLRIIREFEPLFG